MEAIVVICRQEQAAAELAAVLDKNIGNVVRYRKGRRITGGIRHIAETWLLREYPECLLQSQVLLMVAEPSSAYDVLNETFRLVARQANPNEYEVRWAELASSKASSIADSGAD